MSVRQRGVIRLRAATFLDPTWTKTQAAGLDETFLTHSHAGTSEPRPPRGAGITDAGVLEENRAELKFSSGGGERAPTHLLHRCACGVFGVSHSLPRIPNRHGGPGDPRREPAPLHMPTGGIQQRHLEETDGDFINNGTIRGRRGAALISAFVFHN